MEPEQPVVDNDYFGILEAFEDVREAWAEYPLQLAGRHSELVLKLEQATLEEMKEFLARWPSEQQPGKPDAFDALRSVSKLARKFHSIHHGWLRELIEVTPGLDERQKARTLFWANQFFGALSPANFFWTNFAAVQRFVESGGESLAKGMRSWAEDMMSGRILMRMADDSAFKVGENIATTPGAVVFRNNIMELIQFEPSTEKTYPVPLVFIQPWINKYYIFDLAPQMSFVRFMRDRGFTVFITSWKNPDAGMRQVNFEDYMIRGALQAIDIAREICAGPQAHAAGYCIGGTALSALMAWLNRNRGEGFPVADWTVFSSLVDFSEAGNIGFLLTRKFVDAVEEMMKETGFLSERLIDCGFRLLASENLIWRNFINCCLIGKDPPKSDFLFWNSDSTRLSEAMCSMYFREFYLNNRLVEKDALTLGGRPLDIGLINQPLYAVGTQLDHISPWRGTFKICRRVSCPVRYVLSSEGHITGIVNPPSEMSRRKFWAGDARGETDPDQWLSHRAETKGSWWGDWVRWLEERSLAPGKPPHMGSLRYPVLEQAPGTYVMEK